MVDNVSNTCGQVGIINLSIARNEFDGLYTYSFALLRSVVVEVGAHTVG